MIKIEYSEFDVRITGHAGYAGSGRDIICAAVSACAYVLANAAVRMECGEELEREPIVRLTPGFSEIKIDPAPEHIPEARAVFEAALDTLRQICAEYPDFASVKSIQSRKG